MRADRARIALVLLALLFGAVGLAYRNLELLVVMRQDSAGRPVPSVCLCAPQ